MIDEVLKEKKKLINTMDSAILGTVNSKNEPNSSYAPFGFDEDGNFYIYISELSKHTKNIIQNPKISIMIIEDEKSSQTIFARKRLTIMGNGRKINRESKEWETKIKIMENKFDETFKYLKNMEDFHLFQITPEYGLLVYGFGKAFKLVGSKLMDISHLNEKGHKPQKEKQ